MGRLLPTALGSAWLAVAGCGEPAQPPRPADQRLGRPRAAGPPSLRPPAPARSFLVARPLALGEGLLAPVAGALDGATVRWEGSATPRGAEAALRTAPGPVTAVLVRDGRELDRITTAPVIEGPRAVSLPDGALLLGTETVWQDEAPLPCAPHPSGCLVEAPPDTLLTFEGGVILTGAGPRGGHPLPESPDECAAPTLPGPVAGGVVGCSRPDRVDRYRSGSASARRALERDGAPLTPSPRDVSLASEPSGLTFVAAGWFGRWAPNETAAVRARTRPLLLPPVSSGERVVLPFADRLEIGALGSPRRALLPAAPRVGWGDVTVAGDRLAWIDGPQAELRLADADRATAGVLPVPGAYAPVVSAGWLVVAEDGGLRGLSLEGRPGWLAPLDTRFLPERAPLDDLVAVPTRERGPVQVAFVHVPTGVEVTRTGDDERFARPVGADGTGWVIHRWAPGTEGELERLDAPVRILDDDGPIGWGALAQPGGFGGSHQRLEPGDAREVTVSVDRPRRLRTWRAGPSDGTVSVDGRPRPVLDEGWQDLGVLPPGTHPIRFAARPGGAGLGIDALVLDAVEARP